MGQGIEKCRKGVLSVSPSVVFKLYIGLRIPVTTGTFVLRTCWIKSPNSLKTYLVTSYMMLCTIWYHLYNLKNVKDTHRGVLLLVTFRLQLEACNFIKSNIPPWRPVLQLYKKETPTQVFFHVEIAIFLSKNTYGEIEHPRATAFTYTFFLLLEIPTSHMVSNGFHIIILYTFRASFEHSETIFTSELFATSFIQFRSVSASAFSFFL